MRSRPAIRTLATVLLLGGAAATFGCGPHPDEGALKVPPRRRESVDAAKSAPARAAAPGKKNRRAVVDAPVDK